MFEGDNHKKCDLLRKALKRVGVDSRVAADRRGQRSFAGFQVNDRRHTRGFEQFRRPSPRLDPKNEILDIGAPAESQEGFDIKVLDENKDLQQILVKMTEAGRLVRNYIPPKNGEKFGTYKDRLVPGSTRRILMGRDTTHLFVSVLPDAPETVRGAHKALFPDCLRGVHPSKVTRQGEWFFVKLTKEEAKIPEMVKEGNTQPFGYLNPAEYQYRSKPDGIDLKSRRTGESLNPHIADEVVTVWCQGPAYVRGKVRHHDHETCVLDGWHAVVLNEEVRGAAAGSFNGFVD
jgi:hypothetical protein